MRIHTGCRWVARIPGHGGRTRGIAFGQHIFCVDLNPPLAVLIHEAKHVEQYTRYGVLGFLVRYAWLNLRHGYRQNPLEVEARTWTDSMMREPRGCWPWLRQLHYGPLEEPANPTS